MDFQYLANDEKPLEHLPCDGGFTAIFRRIGCVGDSLSSGEYQTKNEDGTFNYTDYFDDSWGQHIARMCGNRVYNFSRGGMTAESYCEEYGWKKGYWDPALACQAYIIALGANDFGWRKMECGTVDDICREDWKRNKKTFAGYMGQIIQRYRLIQPESKMFLVTMPRESGSKEAHNAVAEMHRDLMYKLAEMFPNCYVIDLYRYAPDYDDEFKKKFYMEGHLNPAGYLLTAKIIAAYIDFIVRHNYEDFKTVGLFGPESRQEKVMR